LLPTHACPLHVVLVKVVGRASNDVSRGCMICLTRLPPSKNILRLSTPLISKI
jgi:hypothetical protein